MSSLGAQNPETDLSDLANSLAAAQKLIQGQEFSAAIAALQPLLK